MGRKGKRDLVKEIIQQGIEMRDVCNGPEAYRIDEDVAGGVGHTGHSFEKLFNGIIVNSASATVTDEIFKENPKEARITHAYFAHTGTRKKDRETGEEFYKISSDFSVPQREVIDKNRTKYLDAFRRKGIGTGKEG